jgi:hypothetical protein
VGDYDYFPCGLSGSPKACNNKKVCATPYGALCTDELQADFLSNYTAARIAEMGNKRSVVVSHAFGTHVHPHDVVLARGIALGIVRAAKRALALDSVFIVLEVSLRCIVYVFCHVCLPACLRSSCHFVCCMVSVT